jgi:hypothetical protein
MSKQTAVEWLVEEIHKNLNWIPTHMIEQAKQIEKEQIIEAHGVKTFQGCKQGVDFWTQKGGEQYYNETYGGTQC